MDFIPCLQSVATILMQSIISCFKDLDRGKKWPGGNLMKFSKWKCEILLPGKECWSQGRLGTSWVKSSFAREDLRISVEKKKDMRQWCACTTRKEEHSITGCIKKSIASRWGGSGPSPLLSPDEMHLQCWVPFWASIMRRTWTYWGDATKGPQRWLRVGASVVWGGEAESLKKRRLREILPMDANKG